MEKVQWNSIDKKQNGLKYSKNYKSSTLPRVIKYGNSAPCNERENKLVALIKSMNNEFLLSKNIYSEFTTNVEALTKDMNDYLDKKMYTNFADIAPMILATATNTVLNIIDVDKTARRVHLTKIKPELDQNQQIQSKFTFTGRITITVQW